MRKIWILLTVLCCVCTVNASKQWNLQGDTYTVDTLYHAKVGPGTTQTSLKVTGPVSLRVFYTTTNLDNEYVDVKQIKAGDKLAGLATVSSMAKNKSKDGEQYFVGINADFFGNSKPIGSTVVNKEVYYTVPGRTQWAIDASKNIYLGDMTFGGTVKKSDGTSYSITAVNYTRGENNLIIYTPRFGSDTGTNQYGSEVVLIPSDNGGILTSGETQKMKVSGSVATEGSMTIPAGAVVLSGHGNAKTFVDTFVEGEEVEVTTVVKMPDGTEITPLQIASGCPMILSNGVVLDNDHMLEATPNRHPRTAVGYDETGKNFVMLIVDGRSTISAGAYPKVLADIMREVGCVEAMNFDGGGSSTLYVQNIGIRNQPSDGSERTVTNGVYLVANSPADKEIASIEFVDFKKILPKYGYYAPKFYGYNKYGVLVDNDLQGVTLSCPAELGEVVENGGVLYASGSGTHALVASYNGTTASLVVTIEDIAEPKFRDAQVLLDSFKEYKVDTYGVADNEEVALYNNAFKWEIEDGTIASVDENGVINGLKDGTTVVKGTIAGITKEITVIVEIPTVHYQSVEKGLDVSTWTMTNSNIENDVLSAFGTDGFAIDYTTTSARSVNIGLAKDVQSWSRPDSLLIDINPNTATIKTLYLFFTDYRNPETQLKYELKPSFTSSAVNRVLVSMSEIVDLDDLSSYPLELDSISIVPGNAKGTTHRIEISKFAWVYNAVPAGESSLDKVKSDITGRLLLTPNPVLSGTVVKMNVTEPVKYTVSALNGAIVKTGEGAEISTEGLVPGVYIVNANAMASKLIVK